MNHSPASHTIRALWLTASLLAPALLPACNNDATTVLQLSKTPPAAAQPSLVVAADVHACAQTADGDAMCWGQGEFGQLGDGTTGTRTRPTTVPGLSHVRQIATSRDATCALGEDGSVSCFGSNEFCLLGTHGDATTARASAPNEQIDIALHPTAVPGVSGAIQITMNETSACALRADGTVLCWGRSVSHPGATPDAQHCEQTLAQVPELDHVTQLRARGFRTCALKDDGNVFCWTGSYASDELSQVNPPNAPPQQVYRLAPASMIALGDSDTATPSLCALGLDGTIQCQGDNSMGQLGVGDSEPHPAPVTVPGISGATRLFGTGGRFCAIGSDAKLYCWGSEYFSTPDEQASLGPERCATSNGLTLPCRTSPAAIEGLSDVIDAAVSDAFSCAVSADGTVRCFGVAAHGDLGDGTDEQRLAGPTLVQF